MNWFLAILIAVTAGSAVPASAKKGGKGGGGGGGGATEEGYVIAQLDTANGVGTQGRASDVNDLREVVGSIRLPTGDLAAAFWTITQTNGAIESTLSLLDGGISAIGINNLGEIVGQTYDDFGNAVGVYWPSPTSVAINLPLLPGHDRSVPQGISDDGMICGSVSISGQGWQSTRAVAWRVTMSNGDIVISDPVELPSGGPGSGASAITNNDASGFAQVVGFQDSNQTALSWTVQSNTDGSLSLASPPIVLDSDADALGINNSGLVCGQLGSLAVVWDGAATTTLKRPTKGKNRVPWTQALDVSDSGVIVGRGGPGEIDATAVVWKDSGGSMLYLDQFLDSGSPLQGLSSAEAVNSFGDIVGNAWWGNGAFIAIPTLPQEAQPLERISTTATPDSIPSAESGFDQTIKYQ
jgi:hypothetical protein